MPRGLSALLLGGTLVVAACALIYELVAGAMASYLLGDSVTRFSTVIGTYLFAMGVGAWLVQYLRGDLLATFVRIEVGIAALGGFSAPLLLAVFAWGTGFSVALYTLVFLIGMLVGVEIPLLMRLLRDEFSFESVISRVLSFDYLGALVASLLFPLLLVPTLGLVRTSLLFGLVNTAVALATLYLLRRRLAAPGLWLVTVAVALALLVALLQADRFQRKVESRLHGEHVVYEEQTDYQRIVLTTHGDSTSLYLNGNLQFDSSDEYRYHEALVHVPASGVPLLREVLVLGGGDGMAVREVLRWPGVTGIDLVELDPAMPRLFRDHALLRRLNDGALADPRVRIHTEDAWRWLELNDARYDLVVIDFPDPGNYGISRLYTTTFYHRVRRHLREGGQVVVQATSPYFAREAFWCIERTLAASGLHTLPYHVFVPSFGDWGFVIAGLQPFRPLQPLPAGLRSLAAADLPALFRFPPDMARLPVPVNTLDTQALVPIYERAWRQSLR